MFTFQDVIPSKIRTTSLTFQTNPVRKLGFPSDFFIVDARGKHMK